MALIVEDGSVVPGAESYIGAADAATYLGLRGNATFVALSTEVQEQCLRKATDFMLGRYRMLWKGGRKTLAQRLDWPRVGVVRDDMGESVYPGGYGQFLLPFNIVPEDIKNACAELAYRASIGPLIIDRPYGQMVTQETVGPITMKYDVSQGFIPQTFAEVDMMLAPYLSGGSGINVKLVRV